MHTNENYMPLAAVAAGLTVAILVSFQLYVLREPQRISADEARNTQASVNAGHTLFTKNCAACHGDNGEGGDDGPSLNNKEFLTTVDDATIFSIVSSGVPNTRMPAWNQSHGGPFTDEDVRQVVAYVRSWQPTAPELVATVKPGNAAGGQAIYDSTCVICHGKNGTGTDRAPALNDADKLKQFDDAWYKDVIIKGRPAQGMPTWGTVLSPAQINDLLALLDQWRASPAPKVATPTPTPAPQPTAASPAAPGSTLTVSPTAVINTAETPTATVEVARPTNPGGPGKAVSLTGNATSGATVYTAQCEKCHGPQGKGGVDNPGSDDGTVPPLNPIDDTLVDKDPVVYATNLDLFIEHGSTPAGTKPQQLMPAWGDTNKLTPQQIADVIAYIISLNK